MPETITYDATAQRLRVGAGFIHNVPQAVWAYEVSGKLVLTQRFGDRRPPSPLGDVQPPVSLSDYTTELLNVLNVLGRLVQLEPRQANLLARVCATPAVPASTPQIMAICIMNQNSTVSTSSFVPRRLRNR